MSSIADLAPFQSLYSAAHPPFPAAPVEAVATVDESTRSSFTAASLVVSSPTPVPMLVAPSAPGATSPTVPLTAAPVPPRAPQIDLPTQNDEELEKALDSYTSCFVALDYKRARWSSKPRRSLATLAAMITGVLPREEFFTFARRMARLPGDSGFDVGKLTQAWREAYAHAECGSPLRLILEHYDNRVRPRITELALYWRSLPPGLHLTDGEKAFIAMCEQIADDMNWAESSGGVWCTRTLTELWASSARYHKTTVEQARQEYSTLLDNPEQVESDLYKKLAAMLSAHPGWNFFPSVDKQGRMNFDWYAVYG